MDLCPFSTLSAPSQSSLSPFCTLFTAHEWHLYDFEKSRAKYSAFGRGAKLGPTQGVGWVNELVARLTENAVEDHTSTNRTLDSHAATFPLRRKLYADFSHDNVMTSIFYALGLYNGTDPENEEVDEVELGGFKASETVPFAGQGIIEKMTCVGNEEELVRIVINGRVMSLKQCGSDALGRCSLGRFVDSLAFARAGGRWGECFKT